MSETGESQPGAGWMHAQGDPAGTVRYWNGAVWQGEPKVVGPPPPAVRPAPASSGVSNRTRLLLVFGGIAVFVVWMVTTFVGTVRAVPAIEETGNDFMTHLREGNVDAAAELTDPSCFPSSAFDQVRAFFANKVIDSFEATDPRILSNGIEQTAVLSGTVVFDDGGLLVERSLELDLENRDGWKICGVLTDVPE